MCFDNKLPHVYVFYTFSFFILLPFHTCSTATPHRLLEEGSILLPCVTTLCPFFFYFSLHVCPVVPIKNHPMATDHHCAITIYFLLSISDSESYRWYSTAGGREMLEKWHPQGSSGKKGHRPEWDFCMVRTAIPSRWVAWVHRLGSFQEN